MKGEVRGETPHSSQQPHFCIRAFDSQSCARLLRREVVAKAWQSRLPPSCRRKVGPRAGLPFGSLGIVRPHAMTASSAGMPQCQGECLAVASVNTRLFDLPPRPHFHLNAAGVPAPPTSDASAFTSVTKYLPLLNGDPHPQSCRAEAGFRRITRVPS